MGGEGGGVFDGVEEFAAEVVHAGGEVAELGGELVIADDGRDGDEDAGSGGDEGFGDAGGDGAEGGCACRSEAVEGVDDAPDGAEKADEGGDVADGSEPGDAGFHEGEGFGGGSGGGALHADRVAGETAAAGLALVFVVDLGEDGDQWRGLELLSDGGDFGEATGLAEGSEEAGRLGARGGEGAGFREDDGPGEDGGKGEEDEDGEGYGAGVVEDVGEGGGVGSSGGGVEVLGGEGESDDCDVGHRASVTSVRRGERVRASHW